MKKALTDRRRVTIAERIARVSFGTRAGWGMADHSTQGINTARSGTGVSALFSDASLIAGAIRVN